MDVMIIVGGYIDPTPTRECPNDTRDENYGGQRARRTMQIVLDEYECEAWAYLGMVWARAMTDRSEQTQTRCKGNEDLKKISFWVPVANAVKFWSTKKVGG